MSETTLKLNVKDMSLTTLYRAVSCAQDFNDVYPDDMGARNGVVYECRFYIYRTKTTIVVNDNGEPKESEGK